MQPQKILSSIFGIGLVLLGLLAMMGNLLLTVLGVPFFWWDTWRLWPLLIVGLGILTCAVPFLSLKQRSLGVFFIPGLPVLTTGGILLFASIFHWWNIWGWLWPFEILALAAGFLLAALFSRVVWFGIPAILIGLNGLVLAFCNLTGLWGWWAALWAVEPLAIGLCLLLIGAAARSTAVSIVGIVFCSFAAFAFIGMTSLLSLGGWVMTLVGPLTLIAMGVILLAISLYRVSSSPATRVQDAAP